MRGLLFISLLVFLTSCGLLKKATERTEVNNYYKEYYRDSIIRVPGEIVRTTLDSSAYDKIVKQLAGGSSDTVVIQNTTTGVSMKYYLDALGRVTAECEKRDQLLNAIIKRTEQRETESTSKEVVKFKNNWQMAGIGALSASILLLLIQLFKLNRRINVTE